jgi:hypothetical protein
MVLGVLLCGAQPEVVDADDLGEERWGAHLEAGEG